jgi:hypothetical protein
MPPDESNAKALSSHVFLRALAPPVDLNQIA